MITNDQTLNLLLNLQEPFFHTEERRSLFSNSTQTETFNVLEEIESEKQIKTSNEQINENQQENSIYPQQETANKQGENKTKKSQSHTNSDSEDEYDSSALSESNDEISHEEKNKTKKISKLNHKKRKKDIEDEPEELKKRKKELVSFLQRKPSPGIGYRLDQFARCGKIFISGWKENSMKKIQTKKPLKVVIKDKLFDFCENHTNQKKKNVRRSITSFMNNMGYINDTKYKRGKMLFRLLDEKNPVKNLDQNAKK
eukprot:Anaeramoba_ignava/a8092_82.p1 GENE.a8092_82~~a8092_82.p1  ORF type:complete len:256 (+),score=98.29 a8092_82:59-826(+)